MGNFLAVGVGAPNTLVACTTTSVQCILSTSSRSASQWIFKGTRYIRGSWFLPDGGVKD